MKKTEEIVTIELALAQVYPDEKAISVILSKSSHKQDTYRPHRLSPSVPRGIMCLYPENTQYTSIAQKFLHAQYEVDDPRDPQYTSI